MQVLGRSDGFSGFSTSLTSLYTLFPLSGKGFQGTLQDVMHFYVVTIAVVVLSIVSLLLLFIGGFRHRCTKAVAVLGLLVLLLMLFGSAGVGIFPREYFGLFERFSGFSVVIYTAILGFFEIAASFERVYCMCFASLCPRMSKSHPASVLKGPREVG